VAGPDLKEVRYEDLIRDYDRTMDRIRHFIMRDDLPPIADAGELDGEAYLAKIPEDQRHLHQNLVRKPRTDRIEAWREELTPVQIALTQSGAGAVLAVKGYTPDAEARRRAGVINLLRARLGFTARTWGRRLGNTVRYALTGKLLWRVRVVLNRWRA